jgi:hypothetical protein
MGMNAPPGAGPPPGIPPGGNPGMPPGPPPPPMPPPSPSGLAVPAPPTFHSLPSQLPHGIQQCDGASRNLGKALGTLEFIDNPHERAALVQLKSDLDMLIHTMTRKLAGKDQDDEPSGVIPSDDGEGE